jgi:2,4-dichlorophenol 6-monooxygenase
MIETDVLIIGSGPAGSATALALSSYGVKNTLVTKYRWLSDTPRAHITNQRTMEILRDFGVEQEVNALAAPQEIMGNTVFCTSLVGEELGRIRTWGTHPQRQADYTQASPCRICDMPQHLMEPILLGNAAARGTLPRFNTEYLSLEQDANGVTATVLDRAAGETYQIRAKYLVGADGGRSKVAQDIGLPMEGKMGVAGSMNIVFEADLSKYVAHRPSVLYWVLQPGSNIGGIGMGLVRMVRPWNEWLIVWGYDINQPAPVVDDAAAIAIARNLIGDQDLAVKIKSTSVWTINHMHATKYDNGRVFCMGDAVHRHPPSNGLGSNTSIQDAYNLAWKLAYVLQGKADASLLDSYNIERAPVGKQIVDRANQSIGETGKIFAALGFGNGELSPETMVKNIAARKDATPEAAVQREELREAIAFKTYEFNCHGVELNHRYASDAVVGDGTPEPAFTRDKELYFQATTWPGARLPHVWLGRGGKQISTLDLAGKGKFLLLTGIGGEGWVEGGAAAAAAFGVPLETVVIGPGRDVEDLFGDWALAREIGEAGCVLVRPDMHVAWRAPAAVSAAEATRQVSEVFGKILGRQAAVVERAA